jgi:hypothetical protein
MSASSSTAPTTPPPWSPSRAAAFLLTGHYLLSDPGTPPLPGHGTVLRNSGSLHRQSVDPRAGAAAARMLGMSDGLGLNLCVEAWRCARQGLQETDLSSNTGNLILMEFQGILCNLSKQVLSMYISVSLAALISTPQSDRRRPILHVCT